MGWFASLSFDLFFSVRNPFVTSQVRALLCFSACQIRFVPLSHPTPSPFLLFFCLLHSSKSRMTYYHAVGWGPAVLSAIIMANTRDQGPSLNCHCWVREHAGVPKTVLLAYFLPMGLSLLVAGVVLFFVYRAFNKGLHRTANLRSRVLAQSGMYMLLFGGYWTLVLVVYIIHSQLASHSGRRRPTWVHTYALVRSLNGPVALAAWTLTRPESFMFAWQRLLKKRSVRLTVSQT